MPFQPAFSWVRTASQTALTTSRLRARPDRPSSLPADFNPPSRPRQGRCPGRGGGANHPPLPGLHHPAWSAVQRWRAVWLISLRDLQWRRRRFVIAVVSAALAFALTLLLEGTMAHLRNESQRMVELFDVDAWVVADGASGPFTTAQLIPVDSDAAVQAAPGVTAASPLLVARATVKSLDVNVVGYEPGGLTEPPKLARGAPGRGTRRGDRRHRARPGGGRRGDRGRQGVPDRWDHLGHDVLLRAVHDLPADRGRAADAAGRPAAGQRHRHPRHTDEPAGGSLGDDQRRGEEGPLAHAEAVHPDPWSHQRPPVADRGRHHRLDHLPDGARAGARHRGAEGHRGVRAAA